MKSKALFAGIVVAIVVLLCLIVKQYEKSRADRQSFSTERTVGIAEESGAATDETASTGRQKQQKTKKTSNQQARANGVEIPAYLTDRDEEIVSHEGFVLSYNKKRLVPNWVAWVLTEERVNGTEKRSDNFIPDETIKKGPIAYDSDYRGSGYDRGHMCPAADCKHSRQAMNDCFYFSNMCPQLHALNAGDWESLESICRKWAKAYGQIYIVCGPIIEKDKHYKSIGENGVMVPRQFYKVVLRWDGKNQADAIGFIFNNDDTQRPLAEYAVTVDSVESRTGINFFSKLPKNVEQSAEATFDVTRWKNLTQKRKANKVA